MEHFAQNLAGPFQDETSISLQHPTWQCRKMARDIVQGKDTVPKAAPHMIYNLQYYTNKTLNLFPEKEVFGIRTTHEWEDIVNLDKMLGGSGKFLKQGRAISHGSELYAPSPLSTQAYRKICCVLVDEIAEYQRVLDLVRNLNGMEKREAFDEVREKCGIVSSWEQWSTDCKRKDQEDNRVIGSFYTEPIDSSNATNGTGPIPAEMAQ
jgi:hypothetical protein